MEIGKWKLAQEWIHHPEPKDSRGVWDDLVKVANAEWRNKERALMAEGGVPQLVQPGPGRQGYSGDKTVLQVLRENIEEKGGAKVFQFEKGVTKDGYKKNGLIDKVIKNTNTELSPKQISKLIDQISTEKGWLTKQKYRKWAIVDSYMKDYGINDEFTGAGKFDERLKEFKLKHKGSEFKEINETFNNWRKGDFEVEGYDRSKFDKHLKKNLKNWKPIIRTEKMIESTQELKWLNDINKKYPNWSRDRVEKAFNNKFKKNKFWSDTNFTNRSIDLYGHLVHGKGKNNTVISGVDTGNRSKWVKEVMGEVKGGNYYRFLTAADKYEADGNMQAAKKLRNAAKDLFLKDEGVFYGLGQAEHPWFSNYGGTKGMLQIDSLVKGDLNAFKANNFEIPIRDLIKQYEAKGVSDLQKKRILDEINLRRNFLNITTDIGDGGMARNVTFDSMSTPGKIKVINKTPDIYGVHKAGKLDPLKLQAQGTDYRNKVIQNLTDVDVNILKKDETIKTGKIGATRMNEIIKAYQKAGIGNKCQWKGKAEGGRIGFDDGGFNNCMRNAIEENKKQMMSKTPEERAAAVMKNRNAVNAMKKIKGFGKLITRGVRGTVATLGVNNPGAWLLEAALEGGFYEYYRRKGYTHDQAYAETFIPGMVTGRPEDVPWHGGAEKLLEKELYQIKGENEFIDVENRPPMQDPEFDQVIGERKAVKRYFDNLAALDAAGAEYSQLENAISLSQQGMGYGYDEEGARTNIAEGQARLKELQEEILRLNNLTKEGTPDWQAYQTALEKQQYDQGMRSLEYGEWGQGDTPELAKQRERVRQREMKDKFPDYQKADMDQMLENWGVYIDPNLSYKGKTVQRPKGLQYMGKPVLNPDAQRGWTYDDFNEYLKYQDKMKYFADNFMLEKKTGGRVSYLDGGIVSLLKK